MAARYLAMVKERVRVPPDAPKVLWCSWKSRRSEKPQDSVRFRGEPRSWKIGFNSRRTKHEVREKPELDGPDRTTGNHRVISQGNAQSRNQVVVVLMEARQHFDTKNSHPRHLGVEASNSDPGLPWRRYRCQETLLLGTHQVPTADS